MKRQIMLPLFFLIVGCSANPATNVPAAHVSTPSPASSSGASQTPAAATTPTGPAVSYALDGKAGQVGFVGSKVTGKHDGGFKDYSGVIKLVGNDPEKSSVEVEIKISSMFTDDNDLTEHLQSDEFFDMKKYPTAKFVSTGIAKKDGKFEVSGDLTLHGQTKRISFPAEISASDTEVAVKSEFAIDRFDFDMKYPGKADNLIRKEVVIKLDLKAPKK